MSRPRHIRGILIALAAGLLLASCAYPIRNLPLDRIDERQGYRFNNLTPNALPDTLVIVTASGGGIRAAALELSVLQAMDRIALDSGGTLADKIDIISSVSGGSVTAAYFALHGRAAFTDLARHADADHAAGFLRRDGIGAILDSGVNPVGLARISTASVERIDLLIDYFDQTLFPGGETYGDLLARGRRPYLILNAGDMVEGVPFAFTQSNFDLLCSDLAKVKLSTGVAASAAFPLALSAVTLKNYVDCPAKANVTWPPLWVTADAATSWSLNRDRADAGRVESDYANAPGALAPKAYVHLLDGGIADNLGVTEPIRILTRNAPAPGYLDAIAHGFIKKIVFVTINARSFATSNLDREQATPGLVDMGLGAIDSAIDQASAGAARHLQYALRDQFYAAAANYRKAGFTQMADNVDATLAGTSIVEVNFDDIPAPRCKLAFHNISTSWTNKDNEIDGLLLMGGALMANSPAYPAMLAAVHGHYDGTPPQIGEACTALGVAP